MSTKQGDCDKLVVALLIEVDSTTPRTQFISLKICTLGKIDYLCARKHLWDGGKSVR